MYQPLLPHVGLRGATIAHFVVAKARQNPHDQPRSLRFWRALAPRTASIVAHLSVVLCYRGNCRGGVACFFVGRCNYSYG